MTKEQPRVLLVDGNELNLFLLMDMMQELDVTPIIAESATEALSFASRHEFALILLDIDMPDMNGYQLLNKLAADPKTAEIPVIFMSPNLALSDGQPHNTMLAPVDVVYKPINKSLLLEKVASYISYDEKYGLLNSYYQKNIRNENSTPEGMLALNDQGCIVYANPTAVAMLRSSLPRLIGLYFETLLERSHHEVVSNWKNSVLSQACKDDKTTKVEHTLLWCADGHKLVVSFIAYPLKQEAKAVAGVGSLIVFEEIQNQKYSDDTLSELVKFDPLTRLINKSSFEEICHVSLESMKAGETMALMIWNLDHFDYINESLGNEIGDRLMKAIAQRLSNCIPAHSTLARLGGDEFVLLLPKVPDIRVAITTAHALLTVFKGSFLVGGHEIFVSASAGIVSAPESGTNTTVLLRNADRALKNAKASGRGRVELYNNSIALANVANFEMSTELHQVLAKQQLFLSYKPIINLHTTRLIGMEANLYWHHPQHGVLAAEHFQSIAEEVGLMPGIGEWVLTRACRDWQSWELDPENKRLRIKLSLFHLLYRGFEKSLDKVFFETGFDPTCLELEIAEAHLNRDNLEAFTELFKLLNSKGIKIILDDFGSNYLTLAALEEVEFHGVKLGGNFLRSTLATPGCDMVLKSIIDIAHKYGAEVTASEVARGDQVALLRKLGCDTGALFDKEFGADEVQSQFISDAL